MDKPDPPCSLASQNRDQSSELRHCGKYHDPHTDDGEQQEGICAVFFRIVKVPVTGDASDLAPERDEEVAQGEHPV
ncbi:MAG: hypothetical protein KKA90_04915 [Nanoarchaeota archaeon]|nr:hypothetical protein [Nanoarchaeota archaeon]